MGRVYKSPLGSRNYKNYTEEQLNEALTKVLDGHLSLKKASKEYNIPMGTLHNKIHGKHHHKAGGHTVLTHQEEVNIINATTKCGDWGFPLTLFDVQMFVKNYLERQGRTISKFTNNVPGRDWAYGLIKRHQNAVAAKLASNISKPRASVGEAMINEYFQNLTLTLHEVPASHLFNFDETNVSDDPGKRKVLFRRGTKYPEKITNHSKAATTILMCGSASGVLLPPYIIYKSEHLWDQWTTNGTKGNPCCSEPCCSRGSRFNRTAHGWIDATTFTYWFKTSFLSHARRLEGRKVLIGDNLASHFTDEVITLCEENNVSFVCLPPNATHLDVAFFRPFKSAWRSVLTQWKMAHIRTSGIPKQNFPSLLQEALLKMDDN